MITHDIFSKEEKRLLDFILNQDFENKAETVNYINSLNAESIVRDYSPHHIIMEFRTPNIKDGYFNMTAMVCVDIKKLSEDIATVFTLYEKDGFPFEYEIYREDSSAMDISTVLDGPFAVTRYQ